MLLDPFEEQFDLPAALVECTYGQCWQGMVICEKQQCFAGLCVFEADASQMIRKVSAAVETVEYDGLIADHACSSICGSGIKSPGIQIRFGACDKEAAGLMQDIQTLEIEICPIHHVEGTSFWNEQIENIDIVQLAI